MKPKLIFIADDDPLIAKIVRTRLSDEGYGTMVFSYAEECIASLDLNPDLIILDYYFLKEGTRKMDGLEAFKKIKEYNPDLPVIMLSGQEKGEVVLELVRKGISDYVIKDNNLIESLLASVEEILARK